MTISRKRFIAGMARHAAPALTLVCGIASAALPPPTPAQQQAAAAKKAKDDAQAAEDKQKLAASMEQVTARWRQRAEANGWETHPPVAVDAGKGIAASATQASASGQPGGKQGEAAKQAPVRSEKLGTAPPSEDVKPANPVSVRETGKK
jgi:hypothetical protein